MRKSNVSELEGQEQVVDPLTELLRKGAEQLIFRSVETELQELLREHSDRRTEEGKSGVVCNGYHPEHELQTGVGPVTVQIPKIRSKTGEPVTFHSALVPPYVRKTKSLEAALPWLYLKGISTLTYTSNKALVYRYPDLELFVMSNGSSELVLRSREFEPVERLGVHVNGMPLEHINDLEIDGDSIYANVLSRTEIYRISLQTGEVTGIVDCTPLAELADADPENVLNGITSAHRAGVFYITGKRWRYLFEVSFVDFV